MRSRTSKSATRCGGHGSERLLFPLDTSDRHDESLAQALATLDRDGGIRHIAKHHADFVSRAAVVLVNDAHLVCKHDSAFVEGRSRCDEERVAFRHCEYDVGRNECGAARGDRDIDARRKIKRNRPRRVIAGERKCGINAGNADTHRLFFPLPYEVRHGNGSNVHCRIVIHTEMLREPWATLEYVV